MKDLRLSQASGVPFYRQVRDQIADRIRAGLLAPGAALPSVRRLALEVAVSVITVKKAYEELEAEGLVESRQGRGTFVAEGGAAASRQHLQREIVSALAAVVARAARLELPAERVRAGFDAAMRRHYGGRG